MECVDRCRTARGHFSRFALKSPEASMSGGPNEFVAIYIPHRNKHLDPMPGTHTEPAVYKSGAMR